MAVTKSQSTPDKEVSFLAGDGEEYQLRFFEGNHSYFALGGSWKRWTRVPSTTAISKLADPGGENLLNWAARLSAEGALDHVEKTKALGLNYMRDDAIAAGRAKPDAERQAAADWGTTAHVCFEQLALGRLPLDDTQIAAAIALWFHEWKVKPVASEFMGLHPFMGYAGTGDLLADLTPPDLGREIRAYVDLKTSTQVYMSAWAQVGGYDLAHVAMGRPAWDAAYILHLPRGASKITPHAQADREADQHAFMAARVLYSWRKRSST